MRVSFGNTSFCIAETPSGVLLYDLKGSGSVEDMVRVVRGAKAMAQSTRVYLSVDEDNPMKDRLLAIYKRLGARQVATVLEVE